MANAELFKIRVTLMHFLAVGALFAHQVNDDAVIGNETGLLKQGTHG